ncbi:hypothetical protein AS593_22845 [Caulobacter vibrioides]|nr:hypothetical protein AS593_22845 [Caulobacter vibrioides]
MAILRADAARTRRTTGAAACAGWVLGALVSGGLSPFLFTADARAAEPVAFCKPYVLAGRPLPERAARLVCADPLVSAKARAVESLRADQRRADEEDALAADDELRVRLEACADDACVRAAYDDQLAAIVEGAPFPLAGGLSGRLATEGARVDLWSRDLGAGWRLIRFEGARAAPGRTADARERGDGVFTGAEMFVAREAGGVIRHRRADGGGFDIAIGAGGRWRVTQIGDCLCGGGLNYGGVYEMVKGRGR